MRKFVRKPRKGRRLGIAAMLAVVAVLTSACIPRFGKQSGSLWYGTLTSDSGAHNIYTDNGSTVTATASPPADSTIREAFWHRDTPFTADQETCVTWNDTAAAAGLADQALPQPGLAMRIAPTGDHNEGIKAITVTENTWYAAAWIFNVHVWNSLNPGAPFVLVAQFDLSPIVGKAWLDDAGDLHSTLVPPPWHVCAQTHGSQLTFKVWTGTDDPEPAWDDPTNVFSTTLPNGWDYPGFAGGYAGHLHDGQSLTFSDFSSIPLCQAPDMISDASCEAQPAATSSTSTPDVDPDS